MRYIGLDLGSKTLGISISDQMAIIARIYETFRFDDDKYEEAADYLVEIMKKEKVTTIILGYPLHMNGDIGIRAKISEDFRDLLNERITCKVILRDERLTTRAANSLMIRGNVKRKKRKQKKDELAAVLILQNYLDSL